jgi:hypothetical protein
MDKNKTKSWTKEQQSAYYKEWRKGKEERLAAYSKKWHEENKEYVKQYIEDNKEHIQKTQKEYRDSHQEERKENWQKWYEQNPERSVRRRFTDAKNKAINERKLSWTLTYEDYTKLVDLPCYYCDNKLGTPVKRSVGLDRIDSDKGYELSNVVSCCYICNCIKSQFLTSEETRIAANAILFYRENKSTISLSQKLDIPNMKVVIENFGKRFNAGKRTAKRREHEWTLTSEEYRTIISKPCYYCEFQLGTPSKVSPGLDRLDSKRGYTRDNVVACCWTCNCIKNDFLTVEETKFAVQAILRYRATMISTISQTGQ